MPVRLYKRVDPLRLEGLAAQLSLKEQFQVRGLWGEGWSMHWRPLWWSSIKEAAKESHRQEAAELFRVGVPPFGRSFYERSGNPPWTGHERSFTVALDAMQGQLAAMPFPPTKSNRRRLAELAAFVAAKQSEWGEEKAAPAAPVR